MAAPTRRPKAWRRAGLAVASAAALLLALVVLSGGPSSTVDNARATLAGKLAEVRRVALALNSKRGDTAMTKLDLTDEGDNALAVAGTVKSAVAGGSAEGQNLADADYGTPDDLAAVEAVQAAVKAGADAEVDDAVANSKIVAATDYVAARSAFMEKEKAEPNGGVGSIIAMEGEPGHPANYARGQRQAQTLLGGQHRAYGPPGAAVAKMKLAEEPVKAFEVRVPAGLQAGQQFVADIPSYGQMLITVPKGAAGGQVVGVKSSSLAAQAQAEISSAVTNPVINGVHYVLEMFPAGTKLPQGAIPAVNEPVLATGTSKLDLTDEGDDALAVAGTVKSAVAGGSEEGQNLADADYGTPDDLAAVEAVQAAVKAGADAEVDDAVANSKIVAATDYVAARSAFMEKEKAEPNGGVGSIIAMEGEPGHPANYARGQRQAQTLLGGQHRAYGPPGAAVAKMKLAEEPVKAFEVRVPAGLKAGKQFVADIPSYGRMLVTVPKGAAGGQVVGLKVPATGTSKLDLTDEGDDALAVAGTVKSAVAGGSEEGQNLADADYGTPDDLAAVEAVQAAVKAGADAEVDDAVANSKIVAATDYVAARSAFMEKEKAEPNGGVGSIIAMEGEPGHPANYARGQRQAQTLLGGQHRAYGPPGAAVAKMKLAEEPVKAFEVRVPAGLQAGQQFVADIPSYGRMLVTVPKGAKAETNIEIQVPTSLPTATARLVTQTADGSEASLGATAQHRDGSTVLVGPLHVPKSGHEEKIPDSAMVLRAHTPGHDAGAALKAAVIENERRHERHPAQGVTALQTRLIKQAQVMLARSQSSSDTATRSSAGAAASREALMAQLRAMALSFGSDEHAAELERKENQAQTDAEYRQAIDDLLRRLGSSPVPQHLPIYDGIVHEIPGKKTGGDVERNSITTSPWPSAVPKEGNMDQWKEEVQKGLDGWRRADEDSKDKEIAGMTDEQWKKLTGDDKKRLGDALTKHADAVKAGFGPGEAAAATTWSEEMRKALGAAQHERDVTMRPATPKVAPASLTDPIQTDCGLLRGVKIGGVRVFKGIPYAMPPTGPLRWAPPMARKAMSPKGVPLAGCWTGTLVADSFGKVCPQQWDPVLSLREEQSEDCLSLNVYAPTVESEEATAGVRDKLPVMVFVHGGGNVAGAGSRYDLWNVADRGFVAVSINYRLGALGFLALSALSDEGEGGASGNYGLRDILLSLEWVQSNIASFGGDPARVVLVGHGSGATNVLGLAISPLSKSQMDPACVHARVCAKLFSGIVLLSAGPRIDTPRKQAEAENEVFALTAGCTQPTAAEQVQCLRGLDVKVVQRFFPSYKWDPSENPERNQNDLPVKGARSLGLVIVDGAVIAQDSWTAVQKSGKVSMLADVPVMAMLMSEESDAKPPHKIASWDQFRKVVSERLDSFGTFWDPSVPNDPAKSFTQQAFKLYHTALYKDPQLAYEAMTTDMRLTCSTKKLLNMMSSATTQNIYMGINHLRLEEPVAVVSLSSDGVRSASVGGLEEALVTDYGSKYSFHGLDLVFYLQDESRYKLTPQDKATAESFQNLIDIFVRTGSTQTLNHQFSEPNPLAWSWKAVTDSPNYLVFDSAMQTYPTNLDVADITAAMGEAKVTMTYDYHSKQCAVWAQDGIDLSYASAA